MKVIFALFVLGVCSVVADDAPYPPSGWRPQQRALLILPPQYGTPASNSQANQDEAETLDKVSENVMERLRQEEGSDRGVYHVYLPDGRLQRVQYTTAPVKQQNEKQNSDGINYQQQQSNPAGYQQQYNQYKPNQFTRYPNANVQTNHQQVGGNNQNSFQGNQQQYNRYQGQQQFGESKQQAYTSQYQENQQQFNGYQDQQQFGGSYPQYQGDQYLTPSASQQNQQNSDGKNNEFGDPSQLLAQFSQGKGQNAPATTYVASVQFTDVPPITGPIFSYSPSPLVRIVRYANNYQ